MRMRDAAWLGFKGLSEKKLRAVLTVLMVVIGVASIIALVSQTAGIQASINGQLNVLGPTSISVTPVATTFTDADVARISTLPGVEEVIPIITTRANLLSGGQPFTVNIIGIGADQLSTLVGNVNVLEGSMYQDNVAPLALAGNSVAFPVSNAQQQSLFVGQPMILQQQLGTHVRTLTLSVTGILQTYGSSAIVPVDNSVFVSLDAAKQLLHRSDYNQLLVKAVNLGSVAAVAQTITDIYGNSATVTTIQQITQTVSTITGQIGTLLGAIAGISLTVAAIGILNIMFVSVLERTHEIGILKAVGFKDRHVLVVFLAQAAMIGVVGGLAGLGVGAGVSYLLPSLFSSLGAGGGGAGAGTRAGLRTGLSSLSYTPVISPEIVLASVAIAIVVSIAAGLYPAWRASKMEPIRALKYE